MKALTKKQSQELNEIFNSDIFGILDIEKEKKEIEEAGFNYEQIINFGKELAKQIK